MYDPSMGDNQVPTPVISSGPISGKSRLVTWLLWAGGAALVIGLIVGGIILFGGKKSNQNKAPEQTPLSIRIEESTLSGPQAGTVGVEVTVTGSVERVSFYIDDELRQVNYNPPYTYSLDTTMLSNGDHTMYAMVFGTDSKSVKSSVVTFKISNETPETAPPASSGGSSTSSAGSSSSSSSSSNTTSGGGTSGGGSAPPAPDTAAPSVPQNLSITASDSWTAKLTWNASTDNVGVTGYHIFRDGSQVGTTTQTTYTDLGSTAGNNYSYTVAAADAASNVSAESLSVGITLPYMTIWTDADIPSSRNDSDASAYELGFKFRPKVSGTITGIKFWKSDQDIGTHVGNLWNMSGTNLASATFSSETTSGWQTVQFSSPVAVTANTVYVASYHTNVGHYSADANYFTTVNFDNGYIEALKSGDTDGNNGVFTPSGSSAFPTTKSGNSSHYWVDVTFIPTKGQTATTRVAAGSPSSYQGYPDASTTGIPANTALIKHPRNIIVPAGFNNISVANLDITGYLDIYSNNFSLTNSKVVSTHFWGINQRDVASGMNVDHCKVTSIAGQGVDGGGSDYALNSGSAGAFTARYNDLSLFGKGVQTGTGIVEYNYVHDLQEFEPSGTGNGWFHSDGIFSGGGTAFGVYIHRNTVLENISADHGGTSAIGLYHDFGPQFSITVDDNFLAGGGYTTYGGDAGAHDIVFTNNKISTTFWPNGGFFGPSAYFDVSGTNNVWSNNVWADGPNVGQTVNPAL